MKTTLALLILLSFAALSNTQMSLNLNAATYQVSGGYYSLNVPVTGGFSPFTYNFQAYPSTWLPSGNNINIPLI